MILTLAWVAVVGIVAAVGLRGHTATRETAGSMHASGAAPSFGPSTTAAPSTSAAPSAAPRKPAAATAKVKRAAAARATIKRMIAGAPGGGISVDVRDLTTGRSYTAGATSGMMTASTYKLLVLETLLLQRQSSGYWLSEYEMGEATAAIEQSDNTSGYDLFLDAGADTGLESALQTFGMKNTVPGFDDPTFTTTSAMDCLALVHNLVNDGPLNAGSRSFVLGLMRNVQADQRWGVGAAADPGTSFANKNGWLDIDSDGGLWAVNSVGVVTAHKHTLLLAVMTQHNPDFQTGVDRVEALAKATAAAVTG
jgi:beta-lactamase class A